MANAAPDPTRWPILSSLFDEALDLPAPDRAGWLKRLAEDRPELGAELETLLVDHAASERSGFLDGGIGDDDPAAGGSLAGKVLGAYTLESIVGQGGMGTVWRARRSDGRYSGSVAIKLLNIALVAGNAGARFRREGRILARLTHPNIARLIDAGLAPGGQPYLALEYIEGQSIDRHCDDHRLDCEARIRLFFDVLGAVAHSHAHLIVHRDIKPLNVLVDGDGNVKLLDFGIAKLLEDDATGDSAALTRADARLLTPDYAAPEQFLGRPVTTATDIYSLGVLLYLILSGRHPAAGLASSREELIRAVTEHDAPRMSSTLSRAALSGPPGGAQPADGSVGAADSNRERASQRSTTSERLRRTLAGDLDNIVAKAMRKDPRERYATVPATSSPVPRLPAGQGTARGRRPIAVEQVRVSPPRRGCSRRADAPVAVVHRRRRRHRLAGASCEPRGRACRALGKAGAAARARSRLAPTAKQATSSWPTCSCRKAATSHRRRRNFWHAENRRSSASSPTTPVCAPGCC